MHMALDCTHPLQVIFGDLMMDNAALKAALHELEALVARYCELFGELEGAAAPKASERRRLTEMYVAPHVTQHFAPYPHMPVSQSERAAMTVANHGCIAFAMPFVALG
jgi:hypothetical protein